MDSRLRPGVLQYGHGMFFAISPHPLPTMFLIMPPPEIQQHKTGTAEAYDDSNDCRHSLG